MSVYCLSRQLARQLPATDCYHGGGGGSVITLCAVLYRVKRVSVSMFVCVCVCLSSRIRSVLSFCLSVLFAPLVLLSLSITVNAECY